MGVYVNELGTPFEAMHWTGGNLEQVKRFVGENYGGCTVDSNVIYIDHMFDGYRQGPQAKVQLNSWIIKEIEGEFYTLSDEIFSALYLNRR